MKAQKSLMDSQLKSMSERTELLSPASAAVPQEDSSLEMANSVTAVSDRVTVKMIIDSGTEETVNNWLLENDGKVLSGGKRVLLIDIPVTRLAEIENCPGLRRAEAARVMLPRLEQARMESGLTTALENMPAGQRPGGSNVVIGIVDTGLDYTHPDFRNNDDTSRLELFVHAQRPANSSVSTFDEFDKTTINSALSTGVQIPQGDPHGHGTHCASIAAGNGRALSTDEFRGVAPLASLIAVRSDPLLDTHSIWGIRRTFELAGDRPAVVTLSLGSHMGPHDGTSAIENVIAEESGPGRIVVVAAGNEGNDNIHWQGELTENTQQDIRVRISDSNSQFVDVWVARGDDVDIEIETPDGARFVPDGTVHQTVFGRFRADWNEDPVNQDQNLTLFVAKGLVNSTWKIIISAATVTQGLVHAWSGTRNPSTSTHLFPDQSGNEYSIGIPSTEERAITVGSIVSRNRLHDSASSTPTPGLTVGQVSTFSSHGPSRLGVQKPDICAPGQYITAALATNSLMASDPRYTPRHHSSKSYISIQGTSMATPFIAGLIALMLEVEPNLTPEDVQHRLRVTATRDYKTGRVWDSGSGYGRVNADALLNYGV